MAEEKSPSIADKVRFWEEQDKINQALIPRMIEMHELVKQLSMQTAEVNNKIASAEARVAQNFKRKNYAIALAAVGGLILSVVSILVQFIG